MLELPLDNLNKAQQDVMMDERHIYRVKMPDGEWVPFKGVTSTLKVLDSPGLNFWKVNEQLKADIRIAYRMPAFKKETLVEYENRFRGEMGAKKPADKIAEAAADTGRDIHALIEAYLRKQLGLEYYLPETEKKARQAFRAFKVWFDDAGILPVAMERKVFNRTHRFAGMFDLLAYVDGRLAMVDFKTSKGNEVYPQHRLQVAAYLGAMADEFGFPEDLDAYLVKINRETGETHRLKIDPVYDHWREDYEQFLACLHLSRWMSKAQPRKPWHS